MCVLSVNYNVPLSGFLDKLVSKVDEQQSHMTFQGLLEVCSMVEEDEAAGGVHMTRQERLQLSRRIRLWPLMEEVAVLNQLRLSADLLLLALGLR